MLTEKEERIIATLERLAFNADVLAATYQDTDRPELAVAAHCRMRAYQYAIRLIRYDDEE